MRLIFIEVWSRDAPLMYSEKNSSLSIKIPTNSIEFDSIYIHTHISIHTFYMKVRLMPKGLYNLILNQKWMQTYPIHTKKLFSTYPNVDSYIRYLTFVWHTFSKKSLQIFNSPKNTNMYDFKYYYF